jgi:hypothetical protein
MANISRACRNRLLRAITPMALSEAVMVRPYENIVDMKTTVDVNTAQSRPAGCGLTELRAGEQSHAQIIVKFKRVDEAVGSGMSPSIWKVSSPTIPTISKLVLRYPSGTGGCLP